MVEIIKGTDLRTLQKAEIEEWLRTHPKSETEDWDDAQDYIDALNAGDSIIMAIFGVNMVINAAVVGEFQD